MNFSGFSRGPAQFLWPAFVQADDLTIKNCILRTQEEREGLAQWVEAGEAITIAGDQASARAIQVGQRTEAVILETQFGSENDRCRRTRGKGWNAGSMNSKYICGRYNRDRAKIKKSSASICSDVDLSSLPARPHASNSKAPGFRGDSVPGMRTFLQLCERLLNPPEMFLRCPDYTTYSGLQRFIEPPRFSNPHSDQLDFSGITR